MHAYARIDAYARRQTRKDPPPAGTCEMGPMKWSQDLAASQCIVLDAQQPTDRTR